MTDIKNSEVLSYTLRIFIRVIGRRTAENFAIDTIGAVTRQLTEKYPFLRYVEIRNMIVYSGELDAISINPALDAVDTGEIVKAVSDLFDGIAKSLGASEVYDFDDAEFYFINEIRDELGEHYDSLFRKFGLALDVKQSDFIINMREASKVKIQKMKVSDLMEHIIRILISLLNRQMEEAEVIKTITTVKKNLEGQYDILKFIEISSTKDRNGIYGVTVKPDFDAAWTTNKNTILEAFILALGKCTDLKTRRSFIEDFRVSLGSKDLSKMKKISVNLEAIDITLQQQIHELLIRKTLEVLIAIIGEKTSISYAVVTLGKIITELQEKHDVLRLMIIDKTRFNEGIQAFDIRSEVNTVESYRLGKALKDVIKKTQDNLEDKTHPFVEDFKNRIGQEYLSEIEKIGVNLHLLELRKFV